jgi:hypothetical protein
MIHGGGGEVGGGGLGQWQQVVGGLDERAGGDPGARQDESPRAAFGRRNEG